MTHNRLVTGSSPVGATKFKLLNQYIKPTFELAFLLVKMAMAIEWRCSNQ
ncbi:Uncharacterised protein [Yersinia intermedia]|nr:Uncharacterised protein [Yersinia intermedia]